ncbi:hypothetical protein GCM10025863_12220 [Microbacterium suwonense]|uniref:Uncharacterized protein n=1 Tax=Microbacterium suwonense TaxID=683047 RepID=A0ABN6X1J2_9MICO|nr:hypothetical protein GCM10025863_12220 [Microbacterium suwonense]
MILWFTIVQIVVACASGLFCLVAGFAGRRPSDWTVGSLLVVEVLLIVQVIVAIIAPFAGNAPTGDLLEFWVYLVSAVLLPVGESCGRCSTAHDGAPWSSGPSGCRWRS